MSDHLPSSEVTVELDSGPFTMRFGFVPLGEPRYADVPPELEAEPTEGVAELVGARMLAVGNWRGFHVEKRYWPTCETATDNGG